MKNQLKTNHMIRTLTLLTVFLLFSCNQKSKNDLKRTETSTIETEATLESVENFDWLTGKWKRLKEETGKETFENWDKISPTEYAGIGFTMQNGDTIKQERIRIIKQNGKWDLLVKAPEDIEFITFPITELKKVEFTCTNDSLDFPKQIMYWKNGEKLHASVAGDSIKIEFEFERIK